MLGPRPDRRALVFGLAAAAATSASAQAPPSPASAGPPAPQLVEDVVVANHILFDQGVVDAFGHVSARHDKDTNRFLLSRNLAPDLVAAVDIMEFDLDGTPVEQRGRSVYVERFIHGAIYRARPDVGAVVHSHSAAIIPFTVSGAPLKPVYHMAGFLGRGAPVFEIRDAAGGDTDMLIRDPKLAAALARTLGPNTVALMRGHGSVTVGKDVRLAVMHAVYAEANARLEAEAMKLGTPHFLSEGEAAKALAANEGQVTRAWDFWRDRAERARRAAGR
jgi:HCOMODA/2-hydroxy-3-carboxy-muconic semialdehyde decarboxylase